MNKKRIERVGMGAVIAAFVAYFCYQVAYGLTVGPSGSIFVENTTNGLNATITAPPGTTVSNLTIRPEPMDTKWVDVANSTWTMYNSTSGSVSTMTFITNMHGHWPLPRDWPPSRESPVTLAKMFYNIFEA
jgi:hypothetical protein